MNEPGGSNSTIAAGGASSGATGRVSGRVVALAAALGAFGIVSGGAVFVLLLHEGDHLPYTFLIAMFVAAVVSFGIESVRELVKHGSIGKETFSPPRIVVTILTLMTFELFTAAWHALPTVWGKLASEFPSAVLGPRLAQSAGAGWHFVALGALWLVVGAALAALLSFKLDDDAAEPRKATIEGAAFGAFGGLLIAPIVVFAFLLLARASGVVVQMIVDHDAWRSTIAMVTKFPFPPVRAGAALVLFLDEKIPVPFLWPLASLAIGAVLLVKNRWLFVVALIVFVFPYLEDWKSLLVMLGLVALVFGVPGAVLGGITPWLKQPANAPAAWGSVAFLVAALLVGLTLLKLTGPWFLLPAGILVATGFLVRSSDRPDEWWPLLALAVGLFVFGMNSLVVEATFRGVFVKFHDLLRAAAPAASTPAQPQTPLGRQIGNESGSLPDFYTLSEISQSLMRPAAKFERARKHALELALDERVGALDAVLKDLDARRTMARALGDTPPSKDGLVTATTTQQWRDEADELDRLRPLVVQSRDEAQRQVEERDAEVAKIALEEVDWESHRQDRQFELCITGSFGFWVAVGLMAGFAVTKRGGSHVA